MCPRYANRLPIQVAASLSHPSAPRAPMDAMAAAGLPPCQPATMARGSLTSPRRHAYHTSAMPGIAKAEGRVAVGVARGQDQSAICEEDRG